MKALLPIALLLLTAACSLGGISSPYPTEFQQGRKPEIGARSTAAVGEVVFEEFKFTAFDGARIKAPIRWEGGLADNLTTSVPPGTVLVRYTSDEGEAYCSLEPLVIDALAGPWRPLCLEDMNGDGAFDKLTWLGGVPRSELAPPVPYETGPVPITGGMGARQELAFSGIAGDTLRLSYREYTSDLAKPAFQQDLTYRYEGPGQKIRFRGVEIVVHGVSNDGLEYTVVSGFQDGNA